MPDDGCTKCVIDTSMSVLAAEFYEEVLRDTKADGNVVIKPRHIHAPTFYIGVVHTIFPIAERIYAATKDGSDERTRLMAQLQEECYRADKLNEWGRVDLPTIVQLESWTAHLFEWAKNNQEFYVALAAEVGA